MELIIHVRKKDVYSLMATYVIAGQRVPRWLYVMLDNCMESRYEADKKANKKGSRNH